jgi:hypothetical protein
VTDAADFGAGDGHLDVTVAGDLILELLVEPGLELANLAAAETGDMDMVAGTMGFVIVSVTAKVKKVEFVDEAFFLEKVDGAVDGDEVDFGIDLLGASEDLIDVEVLLGGIHDLKNDAALAGEADAALTERTLKNALGLGDVDAFAAGNTMRWSAGHGASLGRVSRHG